MASTLRNFQSRVLQYFAVVGLKLSTSTRLLYDDKVASYIQNTLVGFYSMSQIGNKSA